MAEYEKKEESAPKESEESERDPDIEALDDFLSGLEPGYTLVISRVEPSWCKGVLEEVPITEARDPVSLNYLINTWGGHKLRLRFRRPGGQWARHRDLSLYSFDPLVFGNRIQKTLPNPHIVEPSQSHVELIPQVSQSSKVPVTGHEPLPDPKREMFELLQMMQTMRSADMQAMAAMMKTQESPDFFKILNSAFALFSQFQTLRPIHASTEPNENDEVLSLIGKLVGVFGQQHDGNPPPKLTPPQSPSPVISPDSPGNERPIWERLSSLEPEVAVGELQNAVAVMPAEKQNKVMTNLLNSIFKVPGGTELLLSQLEQRGIIGDDDEFDSDDNTPTSGDENTRK